MRRAFPYIHVIVSNPKAVTYKPVLLNIYRNFSKSSVINLTFTPQLNNKVSDNQWQWMKIQKIIELGVEGRVNY